MISSISLLLLLVLVATLNLTEGGGGGDGEHHHIIIHVPYHVKKVKHTHTITKHIHHGGGGGEDKYEVLGYTVGKPIKIGGFGDEEGHQGHGEFNFHGGFGGGGQENQGIHYGTHGGHSFEQIGNELNQDGFHYGGHEEFLSYGGGGGGGGHEEHQSEY